MNFLFIQYFLCLIAQEIGAEFRKFFNGHREGGNVYTPPSNARSLLPAHWFTQKLDHFNPTNQAEWQQRYFVNDEFYKEGGPVFLLLGAEGEAQSVFLEHSSMHGFAKERNAIMFQLEHRFYGKSRPTEDLSVENLKFLTSLQALADAATFISFTNNKFNFTSTTRWIVFGGSYGGSLAAWMRLKYPHLVHGAVSSSAPILAQVDFPEYLEVVAKSLRIHSEACVATIKDAFSQISTLLKSPDGRQSLDKIFNLCEPLENYVDQPKFLTHFQESLAASFSGVVQYHKISPEPTIDDVCDVLVDTNSGISIKRLSKAIHLINPKQECFDYNYNKFINDFKNDSWEGDNGSTKTMRQWFYQTCTEFGFYQTSSHDGDIFGDGFPLDHFLGICRDVYGSQFDENFVNRSVDFSNIVNGGLDIKVSNVVFVHGSIDPWHALGIIETRDPEVPAIFIDGTSHCADMIPPSNPTQNPELNKAIQKIGRLVKFWLAQE